MNILIWSRQVLEQTEQSVKFRKLHHFSVMQPLNPGKYKTLLPYYDIILALFTQRHRIISTALVHQFSADGDSHRAKNQHFLLVTEAVFGQKCDEESVGQAEGQTLIRVQLWDYFSLI